MEDKEKNCQEMFRNKKCSGLLKNIGKNKEHNVYMCRTCFTFLDDRQLNIKEQS